MYKPTVTESHLQYPWTLNRKTMVSKERHSNQYYSVKNSAIVGVLIFSLEHRSY